MGTKILVVDFDRSTHKSIRGARTDNAVCITDPLPIESLVKNNIKKLSEKLDTLPLYVTSKHLEQYFFKDPDLFSPSEDTFLVLGHNENGEVEDVLDVLKEHYNAKAFVCPSMVIRNKPINNSPTGQKDPLINNLENADNVTIVANFDDLLALAQK